jgi:alkaline phosphatase D
MSLSRELPISRRRFVSGAAAVAAGPLLIKPEGGYAQISNKIDGRLPGGLFQLGVASGDPLPDGVVLWTRLAPHPTTGGGMPDRAVPVSWEVATDERFRHVRRRGVATARPELGHSVHVDVRGLRSDAVYYYRFRAGGQVSPVGRTRTAPDHRAKPGRLRFAFASCQDYQSGYYTAYQHMAQEDLAFVAFLGDYIYENPRNAAAARQYEAPASRTRWSSTATGTPPTAPTRTCRPRTPRSRGS